MGTMIQETLTLATEHCITCGVVFAFPQEKMNFLRSHPRTPFYCPNGHQMEYRGKSLEDRLNEERLKVQERENQLAEERAKYARLEKRIVRGVCPYCNRQFSNLARHVTCKHKQARP